MDGVFTGARRISWVTIMTVLALAMAGTSAVADEAPAQESSGLSTEEQIDASVEALDNIPGLLEASPKGKVSSDEETALEVRNGSTEMEVPAEPDEGLSLETKTVDVSVALPAQAADGEAERVAKGTVVFPGPDGTADTAVQATADGMRILSVIHDSQAPTEYVYPVELSAGARVESDGADGLVVLDPDGKVVVAIPSPWAKDAEGRSVPVSYRQEGDSIIMTVAHHGFTYPVVADPLLAIAVWAVVRAVAIRIWAYPPARNCLIGAGFGAATALWTNQGWKNGIKTALAGCGQGWVMAKYGG